VSVSLSVIVPVYNDLDHLIVCLEAISQQVGHDDSVEILVVDNGSDQDIRKAVAALPHVLVLQEPTPGPYAARNRAIKEARGQILAFTDADCIPDASWIGHGSEYLARHEDIALVAGKVEVVPANPERPTAAELYEMLNAFPQETYVTQHRFGVTANLFVRKEVFDTVGPFLDSVMSAGDWEFGRRATAAGFSLAYGPDLVVVHPARHTLRQRGLKIMRDLAGMRDLNRNGIDVPQDTVASVLRSLVPPVPSTYRSLTDRRLAKRRDRAKYGLAVFVLHYMRTWARLRLALGARSPR